MAKKIFIIEDDANILYALRAKLSVLGFEVETNVGSDEIPEIIKRIKIQKSDYLICDLLLPKIDGFKLLESLKSDRETSEIPTFIFTNLSDHESREKSERLGANYFFVKNEFILDDFVEKVRKIISNLEKI